MRFINTLLLLITIIGAFNWFLFSVFGFNLVTSIFGGSAMTEKIVYVVVGLSAIYSLTALKVIYKTK